jgi:hypothetical protein
VLQGILTDIDADSGKKLLNPASERFKLLGSPGTA